MDGNRFNLFFQSLRKLPNGIRFFVREQGSYLTAHGPDVARLEGLSGGRIEGIGGGHGQGLRRVSLSRKLFASLSVSLLVDHGIGVEVWVPQSPSAEANSSPSSTRNRSSWKCAAQASPGNCKQLLATLGSPVGLSYAIDFPFSLAPSEAVGPIRRLIQSSKCIAAIALSSSPASGAGQAEIGICIINLVLEELYVG